MGLKGLDRLVVFLHPQPQTGHLREGMGPLESARRAAVGNWATSGTTRRPTAAAREASQCPEGAWVVLD